MLRRHTMTGWIPGHHSPPAGGTRLSLLAALRCFESIAAEAIAEHFAGGGIDDVGKDVHKKWPGGGAAARVNVGVNSDNPNHPPRIDLAVVAQARARRLERGKRHELRVCRCSPTLRLREAGSRIRFRLLLTYVFCIGAGGLCPWARRYVGRICRGIGITVSLATLYARLNTRILRGERSLGWRGVLSEPLTRNAVPVANPARPSMQARIRVVRIRLDIVSLPSGPAEAHYAHSRPWSIYCVPGPGELKAKRSRRGARQSLREHVARCGSACHRRSSCQPSLPGIATQAVSPGR